MNQSSPRRAVLLALCLAAGVGVAQPYVEDSIDVGGTWVVSLCYNSREDVVYGSSQSSDAFFGIDCANHRLVSMFSVPTPLRIVYDSTDNKAYCPFLTPDADSVLVVDGGTHQRLIAIEVDWAAVPVWDPVGNKLYVSCTEANEVAVIDCRTDSVIAHIAVGAGPTDMHLNTRYRKLYVQNYDANSVSIVDLRTNQVQKTIPIYAEPRSGCYSPVVDKYYCDARTQVVVIDGQYDTVVRRIQLPAQSYAKAMAASATEGVVMIGIYGGSPGSSTIWVIDAWADSVIRALESGDGPGAMCWSSTTGYCYSANVYSNDVDVVAADGSAVVASLQVAGYPSALAMSQFRRRLYVSHLGSSKVYVIRDSATGVAELPVASRGPLATLRVTPNPFSRSVVIRSRENRATEVADGLSIYSMSGELVHRLRASRGSAGDRSYCWDGNDPLGRAVPPGVYIAAAEGDRASQIKLVKTE